MSPVETVALFPICWWKWSFEEACGGRCLKPEAEGRVRCVVIYLL